MRLFVAVERCWELSLLFNAWKEMLSFALCLFSHRKSARDTEYSQVMHRDRVRHSVRDIGIVTCQDSASCISPDFSLTF